VSVHKYDLPERVLDLLREASKHKTTRFTGGYLPPSEDILIDAITILGMGKNLLLKGPTGSGKTKLAQTLAGLFHQKMYSINCSVDLDAESLMGFKTLDYEEDKQVISFVPGPVTKAMTEGTFLYIDEINMAKPETLPLLNGVLDYRRRVTNPFTNELIRADRQFNVIAAINEGYIGTVPLNEALKNRFIVIEVPYLQGEKLRQLLKADSSLADETKIDRFVQFSADLVTAVEQGDLSEDAASIRALLDAADLASAIPVHRAIDRAIIGKLEEDREKKLVENIAETLF